MHNSHTSCDSLYDSTSSFEGNNDVDEFFFIAHIINEYEEIFLCKTLQRTSMLSGAQFVRDMIDGSPLDMLWTISNG